MVSAWVEGKCNLPHVAVFRLLVERNVPFNHLVTHAFQVVNNEPDVTKALPLSIVSSGNLKLVVAFSSVVMGDF